METIKLSAKKREAAAKPKKLRQQSLVPAVAYGKGVDNRLLTVPYGEFAKVYKTAGESSLVDLDIEGDTVKTLIKDVQAEPLSGRFTHVDFYQVNLKEKLRVEILLNFVGESSAVKELGGSLVKVLDHIKVECLPTDLVHNIDIDVSKLKSFGDMIHIRDVEAPKGITILDNPDEVIVSAEAPMTEEQFKAMEAPAAVDVTAIKTEGEVKKAEEEAKKVADEAAKEAAK